jgi:hypothetical protein
MGRECGAQGQVLVHPVLGRLDTAENILANKLTALADREEPKDLADVWGFCTRMGLSLAGALFFFSDPRSPPGPYSPPTCSRTTRASSFSLGVSSASAAVTRPKRSSSRATRPVQPVWWLAPMPAPLSPWKYS